MQIYEIVRGRLKRRGGAGDARPPPIFLQSLVFCNYFEEIQIVLFEVKLTINNAPLIYAYPKTIKTCLTPNYLLFVRQLLLSCKKTSTLAANPRICSKFT